MVNRHMSKLSKTIVEGDIVRYPVGMFTLNVRKVYADENGDLYVRECINTKHEYIPYNGWIQMGHTIIQRIRI